jgi:hypothetical protein
MAPRSRRQQTTAGGRGGLTLGNDTGRGFDGAPGEWYQERRNITEQPIMCATTPAARLHAMGRGYGTARGISAAVPDCSRRAWRRSLRSPARLQLLDSHIRFMHGKQDWKRHSVLYPGPQPMPSGAIQRSSPCVALQTGGSRTREPALRIGPLGRNPRPSLDLRHGTEHHQQWFTESTVESLAVHGTFQLLVRSVQPC